MQVDLIIFLKTKGSEKHNRIDKIEKGKDVQQLLLDLKIILTDKTIQDKEALWLIPSF